MNFVYPGFLFALSAIAIPIIIHLFNFRRYKKVYFSDTSLLKEIQINAKSRSRLKHLLILLSRILAVSCLVLAFAKPFLGGNNPGGVNQSQKIIGIFLDNSFSLDRQLPNGYAPDLMKKYAEEIANAYADNDRFVLLTNDYEPKHQKTYTKEEFIELLNEVKLSPKSKSLSDVLMKQMEIMQKSRFDQAIYRSFIISDFQDYASDFGKIKSDSTTHVTLIPVQTPQPDNVYVDSVWFDSPEVVVNSPVKVYYRARNNSDKTIEDVTVRLYVNKEQKTPGTISLAPKSKENGFFEFIPPTEGKYQCKISIDDNSISFDDEMFFSFNITSGIEILEIKSSESGNYLQKLYNSDGFFRYKSFSDKAVDFSIFKNQNLIVLNEVKSFSSGLSQEIKKANQDGVHVLLIASQDCDIASYNQLLNSLECGMIENAINYNSKADKINADNGFYDRVFEEIPKNMDMPTVKKYYPLKYKPNQAGDFIIKLPNGDPLLMAFQNGKGKIYVLTTALKDNYSNFHNHALFVPTMLRIGFMSQIQNSIYYSIGKTEIMEMPQNDSKDEVYKIKGTADVFEFIPEQRNIEGKTILYHSELMDKAGNFVIKKGNNELRSIAYNYNRMESRSDQLNPEDLKKKIEENNLQNFSINTTDENLIQKQIAEKEEGISLWKFFLILALVFLLTEVLLLRFL